MLCSHVTPQAQPFETLFVIEEHLGMASGLVECRACHASYLLEMIDLAGNQRAYRVTEVDSAHAIAMVRTLSRGTCDTERARGEVQNLESRSQLLNVTLNMQGGTVINVVPASATAEIPKQHWRALPCDGRWLRTAQAPAE